MDKIVSIIIPVYNVEKYVKNTVNTVLMQDYDKLEIILVDDGSTDKSGTICDELAKKDKRIKVVHKSNGGLSSSRNAGLDNMTGQFVLFLDGDDYIALNAVSYLVEIQNKTDVDIVHFSYEETECEYQEIKFTPTNDITVKKDTKEFYDRLYALGGEGASACTKLYKASLFDGLRFKEGILHEDEYMITRMLDRTHSIAYVPDKLYFYVMRGGSIIHSFGTKKLDRFFVSADRIDVLKKKNYSDLAQTEQNKYFEGLLNYLCLAKKFKNKDACNKIYFMIKDYYSKYSYTGGGMIKVFYSLCRVSPKFAFWYYVLRKSFGHIEGGV